MKWTETREKTHSEQHGNATACISDGLELIECEYKEHRL